MGIFASRAQKVKDSFQPRNVLVNKIRGIDKITVPTTEEVIRITNGFPVQISNQEVLSPIYNDFYKLSKISFNDFPKIRPEVSDFIDLRLINDPGEREVFLKTLYGDEEYDTIVSYLNKLTSPIRSQFEQQLNQTIAAAEYQVKLNVNNPEPIYTLMPRCMLCDFIRVARVIAFDKNRGILGFNAKHIDKIVNNYRKAGTNLVKLVYNKETGIYITKSGHHSSYSILYRAMGGYYDALDLMNPVPCSIEIYDEKRFIDDYITEDNVVLHSVAAKVTNDIYQLGYIPAFFDALLKENGYLDGYAFKTSSLKTTFSAFVQAVFNWINEGRDISKINYQYIYTSRVECVKQLTIPAHRADPFPSDFIRLIYNGLVLYEQFMKKAHDTVSDKSFLKQLRESAGFSILCLTEYVKSDSDSCLSPSALITARKLPDAVLALSKLVGKLTKRENLGNTVSDILTKLTTSNRKKRVPKPPEKKE
jgi:hypothetical protein